MQSRSFWNSWVTRLTVCLTVAVTIFALGADAGPSPAAQSKKNRFIGVDKCQKCHDKDDAGNQHAKWLAGPHSKAFETLAGDAAKKIAAERGIADPQKSPDCLRCHTTAYGEEAAQLMKGFDPADGVQCESCHAPGEVHFMARFRGAKDAGSGYPDISPEEMVSNTPASTCLGCHNEESPTFKPFCPHERKAEIRHLNPKKPRTPEELAALTACTCAEACVCRSESADKACRSAGK